MYSFNFDCRKISQMPLKLNILSFFRRKRTWVPYYPQRYRELLLSQGSEYRSQDLPGDPGYSAADDVSSNLTQSLSTARGRSATLSRNHLYSHIGDSTAPAQANGDTTAYEAVTTTQIYSYAGYEGSSDVPRVSPTQTVYSYAIDVPDVPKYAEVQRKSALLSNVTQFV